MEQKPKRIDAEKMGIRNKLEFIIVTILIAIHLNIHSRGNSLEVNARKKSLQDTLINLVHGGSLDFLSTFLFFLKLSSQQSFSGKLLELPKNKF